MRSSRSLMCGTAAAASSRSTVMRTISEPARASAATCCAVACDIGGVGVGHRLHDDRCAAADGDLAHVHGDGLMPFGGAGEFHHLVTCSFARQPSVGPAQAGTHNHVLPYAQWPRSWRLVDRDIASPRPVYEHQPDGDERHRQGKRRSERLVEDQWPATTPNNGVRKVNEPTVLMAE